MTTQTKDASIVDLVRRLGLAERGWVVLDHWEADRCAIGIAATPDPAQLVYVCTFQKRDGYYDYTCESSPRNGDEVYSVASAGEDVTFDTLLDRMFEHLHQSNGTMPPMKPSDPPPGPFGLSPAHARALLRLALVIPIGVPTLLAAWVLAARHFDWDVVESARRSAVTLMVVLALTIAAPLVLREAKDARERGFVVFWFCVSSFFNLTWQVPLIVFRGTITTAEVTHDNLARYVAWWGYGFADAHYGRVSRWMMAEELWWLMAIAMSLYGLRSLYRGREVHGFFWLGIAGALEAYNASLYIVYDVMTGLANVPSGSTTSMILYWGFNPLWAGAALLASVYAFRVVLANATSVRVTTAEP